MANKTIASKQECPLDGCGSSDAYYVYEDNAGQRFGHCYSCGQSRQLSDTGAVTQTEYKINYTANGLQDFPLPSKPHRGISVDTMEFFGVKERLAKGGIRDAVVYEIPDVDGVVRMQKLRTQDKTFFLLKDTVDISWNDVAWFGYKQFKNRGNGKRITITEGENDAMATYQMQGDFPVLSLPAGVDTVRQMPDFIFEYINSFDEVRICLDADEQGRRAAEQLAQIFPTKSFIVELDGVDKGLKDAHDYLQKSKADRFKDLWWKATKWSPGDVVYSSSLVEGLVNKEKKVFLPYPFDGLNRMVYGMHTPDVICFNAPPKAGKSMITGVIADHILRHKETVDELWGKQTGPLVADISIEDTPDRRAETLMSLRLRKALHIPEIRDKIDKEILRETAEVMYKGDDIVFYDRFGSNDVDGILARIDFFTEVLGVKFVILDHISYLASYHEMDERKALDRLSNELAQKATSNRFCLFVVAHQNREGKIHGSSNIEKVAYLTVKLFRDKDHENPEARNIVKVTVEYNRLYGRTGDFYLRYRENPYELVEIPEDEAIALLEPEKNPDDNF